MSEFNNDFSDNNLISTSKTAEILGVSIYTIRRWIKAGVLRPAKIDGKNYLFSAQDIEKFKLEQPLTISEVSERLNISQSTLRRLEERGFLVPERNGNGERVYSRELLDKFIHSDYFLKRKDVEEKVLEPLAPEQHVSEEQLEERDFEIDVILKKHEESLTHLKRFKKTILMTSSALIGLFLLITGILSLFYAVNPESTARALGYYNNGSALYTNNAPEAAILRPFSSVAVAIVEKFKPEVRKFVPENKIPNVNTILVPDEEGNLEILYGIKFPKSSYLKIPDSGLVINLNAEFVQGKEPGNDSGNLAVLPIDTDEIKDGSITEAKLAFEIGTGGGDTIINESGVGEVIAGSGLVGGGSSDSVTLAVGAGDGITVGDDSISVDSITSGTTGVSGSNSGIESTASGIRLLGGCADNEILKWDAASELWECAADSGGGGGSIDVEEGDATITSGASFLDFNASDFTVTDSPAGEANISIESIPLGTKTTGNYVATITGGAGLTGSGASEGSTPTLAVGAGNGISVAADSVTLSLQANKGLEVDGSGLSLIDCGNNEILKYSTGTGQWTCQADADTDTDTDDQNLFETINTSSGTDPVADSPTDTLNLTGGTGISATGDSGTDTVTFDVGGGLGLTANADDLDIDLLGAVDSTGSTSNNSGLEFQGASSDELTLLQGCADNEILKWDETSDVWGCETDIDTDTTGSFTLSADSGTDQTISNGDTLEVAGGSGLTSTASATDIVTLAVGAGNGISVAADSVTLSLQANKGLEVDGSGLSLIDCANNEIFKYETGGNTWACSADSTGGGANSFETINAPAGTDPVADSATDTLNLTETGENLTITGASGTDTIDFDLVESTLAGAGSAANGSALDVVSANGGIVVNTNDIALTVAASADALSSTTSSGSGLEILASGLTLLQGCANNEILKWVEASDVWNCAADVDTDTTGSFTLSADSGTDQTISNGNTLEVTGGSGLTSATSATDVVTLAIGDGDGVTINADSIEVDLDSVGADGSTTSSVSGLEFVDGELSLIRGCAAGGILEWDNTNFEWDCGTDDTGGGGANSFETINAPAGTDPVAESATDTLNLTVTGTNLTITGTSSSDTIDFDIAESALAGAGLAASGSALDVGAGSGISVAADSVALGDLTADWDQNGAFDIVLDNADSQIQILESAGATFYGTVDVGDLAANATYTLSGASGTLLSTANYTGTLDSVYVNVGESPAAGDITGSFSGGLNVGTNSVALTTDTTGDYVATVTGGTGLTGSGTGEGSTPTLAVVSANGGIVVNADDIALTVAASADALSTTTSSGSGMEILTSGLTLLQGCANNEILKWVEASDVWNCAADVDTDTTGSFTLSADSGTDQTISNGNTLEVTGGSGLTSATSATDVVTLTVGAGVGITVNADDIQIDQSFSPTWTGAHTFNNNITANDAGADTILIGQSGATDDTVTIAGDVSLTDDQWSISATGAASGLSGTNTSFTAGDLSCTNCIGATEIDESTISSTGLSDTADIAYLNQSESVLSAWTFNTDVNFTLTDTENIAITNTVTGTNALDLISNVITNNTTSGTQRAVFFQNAAGSGVTEALIALDNADTDTAVTDGIIITSAAGLITDALDLSDAEIDNALNIGANNIVTAGATIASTELDVLDAGITESEVSGEIEAVTAGSGLTGGGTADSVTLTIVSANGGIVVNADDIALTVAASADALSTTTSSGSGMEILTSGLTLLQGCANNEILKWVEASDVWNCAADVDTDTTGSFTLSADSGTDQTISNGDTLEITGGSGLTSATSATDVVTLNISGGAGITANADDIVVDLLDSADGTGGTSNNSGLEFQGASSDELTLLQGCANNEILKWTEASSVWGCSADSTGGGGTNSFETINAPAGTDPVADSATDILLVTETGDNLTITGDSSADSIDFDIVESTLAGSGLAANGSALDVASANGGIVVNADDIALTVAPSADALSATTSSGSGLEILSSGLTLLQGCSNDQILKWVEASDVWNCAADVDTDTTGSFTLSADSGTDQTISNGNTLEVTGGSGLTSATSATDAVTLTVGAGVGITVNADDIAVDQSFSPTWTGAHTFNNNITANDAGADTILIGQSGATDDTVTIAGDVSLTDDQWSISATGAASGLSGTNTSFTAGDLSCTNCIGATEIDESTIASTSLSDTADIAYLNQSESVLSAWTFNTDVNFTLADTENIAITNTVTGTNALDLVSTTLTNQTTSGTQRGLVITNANDAANAVTESLILLDNAETTASTLTDALRITSSGVAGGVVDAIDVSDSNITNAINIGANDIVTAGATITSAELDVLDAGITESEVTGEIEAVTAGSGLTGGGTADSVTLTVVSANGGIVVNADDIALTVSASADALSATTSSGSGLEILSSGLTLLQGCSNDQILKWVEASDVWNCAADSAGSSSNSFTTIDTEDGTDPTADTSTDTLIITSTGANLTVTGANDPESVTLDLVEATLAGSGLAANGDALDITVSNGLEINADAVRVNQDFDFTLTGNNTFTPAGTDDLDINLDSDSLLTIDQSFSGTTTVNGAVYTVTNSSTSGTQNALYIDNAASTGTTEALLVIDNSDTNTAVGAAIQFVDAGGTFTSLFDVAGTLISTSEFTTLDGGITESEVSGEIEAVTAGSGLTGGGAADSVTLDVGAGSGITVAADSISLGVLTASWDQTGAFDIDLNNASSELRILESSGATFFGIFDVGDLSSSNKTYTFPDITGTVALLEGTQTFSGDKTFSGALICTACIGSSDIDEDSWVLDESWLVTADGTETVVFDITGTGHFDVRDGGASRLAVDDDGSFSYSLPSGTVDFTVSGLDADSQVIFSGLNSCDTIDTNSSGALSCGTDSGAAGASLQGSYDSGNSITTSDARDIDIVLANTTTDSNLDIDINTDSTSTVTISRLAGAGTANPAQLLLLEDLDADLTIADGLKIQTAGVLTDAIDLADAEITNALNIGANNIVTSGATISSAELDRLDGKDANLVDENDLTSGDGAGGTSSGSGMEAGTGGIGLLQGCANNEILKWNDSGSTWDCGSSNYSKFISVSANEVVADTGNTADQAGTDVDVTAVTSANATHVLVSVRLEMTTIAVDSPWTAHVMPNGTAVADSNVAVGITTGDSAIQHENAAMAIVELDTDEIFDYGLDEITGTATVAVSIYVLGYWEPVTTGADLAENYYALDKSINPGDLVSLDPTMVGGVKKSSGRNDGDVIGVVSTQPGIVLDDVFDPSKGMNKLSEAYKDRIPLAVALAGRIPVNVSTENGPIKAGDYLTASSTPGVAMKATKAGTVLGQALFGYDKKEIGAVMMFVKNTSYQGGSLENILPGLTDDSTEPSSDYELGKALVAKFMSEPSIENVHLSDIFTDRLAAAVEIITPKITADNITARSIKAERIEGLEIYTDKIGKLTQEVAALESLATDEPQRLELESAKINKGLTVEGPANFKEDTIFDKIATFIGKVVFRGNVEFLGRPSFNKDTAGFALISPGAKKVHIEFEREYADRPVATAMIVKGDFAPYTIDNLTTKGFDIILADLAHQSVEFSWTAFAINDANTFKSQSVEQIKPIEQSDASPESASEAAAESAPATSSEISE